MESWTDFGEGCQDFAVWFVEAFPTLMVLGIIGGVAAIVIIRLNRKAEARRKAAKVGTPAPTATPPYRPVDRPTDKK